MRTVREVIIVEGRYDKSTVAQVVSGTIIETYGFGVFSNNEKLALLRKLAAKRGLIILTDSDKAGFFIRGRLKGILGETNIKQAYIPDVEGRERRKPVASKEGKLGVEGMRRDVIITALERAGATFEDCGSLPKPAVSITKADLFAVGLSGTPGSLKKRDELMLRLELPQRLSANGLLDVLNVLYTREEFLVLTTSRAGGDTPHRRD